jgi:SAM-dependent methyltransferase
VELTCLACGRAGLTRAGDAWTCAGCPARFPVIGGIPRFVAAEHYAESFGFQWNRFDRTQLDSARNGASSRDTFVGKTGWSLDSLRGKRVLDVGCGMGRFAEVCADAGAEVHAIDLSRAVEAAARNLGGRPNVRIYQADVMRLPFAAGSFDAIYSIGVLHHTPDTRAAFQRLPGLLKPGGAIAIWVYSARLRLLIGSEILRAITPRLPKPWLLRASRIAIPLYRVHRVPGLGKATRVLLPTSMEADPEGRWLDTFDWYSPRYQWKHTYEEVEGWFRQAGLVELRRGALPVAVSGLRPRTG